MASHFDPAGMAANFAYIEQRLNGTPPEVLIPLGQGVNSVRTTANKLAQALIHERAAAEQPLHALVDEAVAIDPTAEARTQLQQLSKKVQEVTREVEILQGLLENAEQDLESEKMQKMRLEASLQYLQKTLAEVSATYPHRTQVYRAAESLCTITPRK